MLFKLFLFLIPALLLAQEIVIDSSVKIEMSQAEYNKVMHKYLEPIRQKELEKQRELANKRLKELEKQEKIALIKQRELEKKRQRKIEKELVRQKEIARQKEVSENTTTVNGFMWQDNLEAETVKKDWQKAKRYCKNLKLLGYDDWRLPSKSELESIVDKRRRPAIKNEFSFVSSSGYWSSTTLAGNPSIAWHVYFYGGYSYYGTKTPNYYVRCVRGGQ